MLQTYLTIFLRKFKKERLFSLLNLGGLTVGLTTVLLIGLYVYDELSYDKFHSKSDDIYLLYSTAGKNVSKSDRVSYRLAERIKEEIPEVENMVSLNKRDLLVASENNAFLKNKVAYATPEFFEVFDFPLLYGNVSQITEPSSTFITAQTAEKFFGDVAQAMGKRITVNEKDEYTIAGVLEDIPANSTIQFEFLLPGKELFEERMAQDSEGGWFPTENWLILNESSDREVIAPKMEALARTMPFAQVYEYTENAQNIFLLPLSKYRLRADLDYSSNTRSDIRYVYLFMAIGLLVLIIAVINYTNLATAQSIKRSKEVGLRKVIGASRRQVLTYYLTESFALVFLSAVLAFAITERALPFVNDLLNKDLKLDYFSIEFFVIIIGATASIGLLAGLYPAFFLSQAKPLQAFTDAGGKAKQGLRRVLIITQFFIAQLLIIGTVIIQQQLNFIQSKNLGYDREHLIQIDLYDKAIGEEGRIKNDLLGLPGVESVSLARNTINWNDINFLTEKNIGGEEKKEVIFDFFSADEDFVQTMGMELIMGENLQPGEDGMLINQSAFQAFGWEDIEGKTIRLWQWRVPVKGVIKDFHNESLKSEIRAAGIANWENEARFALVRLSPNTIPETIKQIEAIWNDLETGRPIDFQFLDESYSGQYETETNLGQLFVFFSCLAILIAILGLIGLSTFTIEQRLKEISLRRVLGASYQELFQLFAKSYIWMILLGFVIAAPVVYYFIQDWLAQFVYRIELSVVSFSSAVLITLLISLIVIFLQIAKTKRINPAETLRVE